MSKTVKKSSHKELIESSFGVKNSKNDKNPFDIEDEEQFGSRFTSKKKIKDKQYDRLMLEFADKGKKPEDFEVYEKYKGKKVTKNEIFNDFNENEEEIYDNDIVNEDKEKLEEIVEKSKKTLKMKKMKKNEKQLKKAKISKKTNSLNIDDVLQEIDEEDQQEEVSQAQIDIKSLEKSKAVSFQLKFFKILLSLRMQLQQPLELFKKYPKNIKNAILEKNEKIEDFFNFSKNLKNQLFIVFLLEKINKMQEQTLKSSSFNQEIQSIPSIFQRVINDPNIESPEYEIDAEAIYKKINGFYGNYFPWAENVLTKWSEKTNILSSKISKTGLKNLLHTPIGQVNKMMENFEKLQVKSQLKRGAFRVLGTGLENLERDFDEEIYDDSDLMQELMKSLLETEISSILPNEGGSLFDSTRQYLLDRKLKNEEKTKKNVDRRASKNRKLRYEIHAKLVNFMQCEDRIGVLEGRDEILAAVKRRFVSFEPVEGEKMRKKAKRDEDEPRLI